MYMYMYFYEKYLLAEHHHELENLQLAHADAINELEKTRKLLQLQHDINKDYKKDVPYMF